MQGKGADARVPSVGEEEEGASAMDGEWCDATMDGHGALGEQEEPRWSLGVLRAQRQ